MGVQSEVQWVYRRGSVLGRETCSASEWRNDADTPGPHLDHLIQEQVRGGSPGSPASSPGCRCLLLIGPSGQLVAVKVPEETALEVLKEELHH